jgi:hypothetical protein
LILDIEVNKILFFDFSLAIAGLMDILSEIVQANNSAKEITGLNTTHFFHFRRNDEYLTRNLTLRAER